MLRFTACVLSLCLLASGTSFGAFNLQITETFSGNSDPGDDLTTDWIEVTNLGTTAWNVADGKLYYDDDSQDASRASELTGITSIAPGQSIVFIDIDDGVGDIALFANAWPTVSTFGTYAGSGMSQNGDGATLFFDAGDNGVTGLDIIDYAGYPDANAFSGQSFDHGLQAFSTVGNANGAFLSATVNSINEPGIASPGIHNVPEPGTIALMLLGVSVAAMRYRLG